MIFDLIRQSRKVRHIHKNRIKWLITLSIFTILLLNMQGSVLFSQNYENSLDSEKNTTEEGIEAFSLPASENVDIAGAGWLDDELIGTYFYEDPIDIVMQDDLV